MPKLDKFAVRCRFAVLCRCQWVWVLVLVNNKLWQTSNSSIVNILTNVLRKVLMFFFQNAFLASSGAYFNEHFLDKQTKRAMKNFFAKFVCFHDFMNISCCCIFENVASCFLFHLFDKQETNNFFVTCNNFSFVYYENVMCT